MKAGFGDRLHAVADSCSLEEIVTVSGVTESVVEDAALAWLEDLGYTILHGPEIAIDALTAERSDPNYRDVVLESRLGHALFRLNPDLPPEALEDAFRKLTRVDAPSLLERNRAFHRMLVDGVNVEYRRADGSIGQRTDQLEGCERAHS
jgi:type I restriction enzyme R subunit